MKYSKARALAQVAAASLKYAKLPIGEELSLVDVKADEIEDNNGNMIPNDTAIFAKKSGGNVKVSLRELFKMSTTDGGNLYSAEDDADEVEIPEKIAVRDSEDRTDSQDRTVFPILAYKGAEEMLKSGDIDWNALVEAGVKEDHGFEPVQNYTVEEL